MSDAVPDLAVPQAIQAEEDQPWSCGYCRIDFSDPPAISVHMDAQHSDIDNIMECNVPYKNLNVKHIRPFADLTIEHPVNQKISESESSEPSELFNKYFTDFARNLSFPRYISKEREEDKNDSEYQNCSESNNVYSAMVHSENIRDDEDQTTETGSDLNNMKDHNINKESNNNPISDIVIEFVINQNSDETGISLSNDFFYDSMQNGGEEIDYCVDAENDNEDFIRALTEGNKIDENYSTGNCIIEDSFLNDIQNGQSNLDEIFVSDDVNMLLYAGGSDEESVIYGQENLDPIPYSIPDNNCSQSNTSSTAIRQAPLEMPPLVVSDPSIATTQTPRALVAHAQMPQTQFILSEMLHQHMILEHNTDTKIMQNELAPMVQTQKLQTQMTNTQIPQTQITLTQISQTHSTLTETPQETLKQMPITKIILAQTQNSQIPEVALSQMTRSQIRQTQQTFDQIPEMTLQVLTTTPQTPMPQTQTLLSTMPQTQTLLNTIPQTQMTQSHMGLTIISQTQTRQKQMPQSKTLLSKMSKTPKPQTQMILTELPQTQMPQTQMPNKKLTLTQIDLPLPPLVPVKKDRAKLSLSSLAVQKTIANEVSLENVRKDISQEKSENDILNIASTTNDNGSVKCPFCKEEFQSKSPLWIHLRTHQNRQTCLTCGITIEISRTIKRKHEAGQPIQCLECDKSFQSPGHLQQHMVVHAGLPKSDKLRRSVHLRMYRRMRPLMCWDCANGFRELSAEAALADWGRIVSCPQCSFVFPSRMNTSQVSKHIAQHLNNIPDDRFDD